MKLVADLRGESGNPKDMLSGGILTIDDKTYPVTNKLRTMREGTRESYEVIRSLTDDLPYDPQPFPPGLWNIVGLEWQSEKKFNPQTYGPVKIVTDAWQWVNTWKLDANGDYLEPTGQWVKDIGYLLHYSVSTTTLGCIRLASPEDAIQIAEAIQTAWDRGETVQLEVI